MDTASYRGELIRVIDIETTGAAPPSEIIELGWADLVLRDNVWTHGDRGSCLFRPMRGIPAENQAIHHISEREIGADAEACNPQAVAEILLRDKPCALAAHNARFERQFIGEESFGATPWICTLRSAVRVWPQAPRHSNQVLRYWLGLDLDPALAMPVHRAGPDAFVTANILVALLSQNSVEELMEYTVKPRFHPVIRFGRYRGEAWSNIPADYLRWIVGTSADIDVKACAEGELRRRADAELI